jgi:hypothetical protein
LAEVHVIVASQTATVDRRHDPERIVAVVHALAALMGDQVVTARAVREQHANTVSWIPNEPPDVVVFPQSTVDVHGAKRASHSGSQERPPTWTRSRRFIVAARGAKFASKLFRRFAFARPREKTGGLRTPLDTCA